MVWLIAADVVPFLDLLTVCAFRTTARQFDTYEMDCAVVRCLSRRAISLRELARYFDRMG